MAMVPIGCQSQGPEVIIQLRISTEVTTTRITPRYWAELNLQESGWPLSRLLPSLGQPVQYVHAISQILVFQSGHGNRKALAPIRNGSAWYMNTKP
jgi:hypothetical protein